VSVPTIASEMLIAFQQKQKLTEKITKKFADFSTVYQKIEEEKMAIEKYKLKFQILQLKLQSGVLNKNDLENFNIDNL
jgi:hypothetical protein